MSVADFVATYRGSTKSTPEDEFEGYVFAKLSIVQDICFLRKRGNAIVLRNPIEDALDELFRPEEISITWEFEGGSGIHWMLFPMGNATPITITPEDLDNISSP